MINVSEPFLPPIETYTNILEKCWTNKILTNRGPQTLKFEQKISQIHGLIQVSTLSNCTVGLEMALKILARKDRKKVIVTPFTFKATLCAIENAGFEALYCDIFDDGTIDVNKVYSLITDDVAAILPVHVYGVPCNDDLLSSMVEKNKIPVIYDAAHCFGVFKNDKAVFGLGDASVLSLHATKGINCAEGGAVYFKNPENYDLLQKLVNFNLSNNPHIGVGTNGKLSELHSAFGLAVLDHIDEIQKKKYEIEIFYRNSIPSEYFFIKEDISVKNNNLYTPLILSSESKVIELMNYAERHRIGCRRYFHPSLDSKCYNAHKISQRILCIPNHTNLSSDELYKISDLINDFDRQYGL